MDKPFAVVFAGVPGSSKSIVAQYLSYTFDVPMYSNDVVRSEVKEDLLVDDINKPEALREYHQRSKERCDRILAAGRPIIFDFSVDRRWAELKPQLLQAGYEWFLIDMELSEAFLQRLFAATKRKKFIETQLPMYLQQHAEFMEQFAADISVHITDGTFHNRLQVADDGLRSFLGQHR